MVHRVLVLILLAFFQCSLPGCSAIPAKRRPGFVPISIRSEVLWVELATTNVERARGLMWRPHLPEDEGMIFIYPSERPLSFWMHNTLIDLDIAFVSSSGTIVDIRQMRRLDKTSVSSAYPAKYAIEANKGWFEKRGIRPGDVVRFPPEILQATAEEEKFIQISE